VVDRSYYYFEFVDSFAFCLLFKTKIYFLFFNAFLKAFVLKKKIATGTYMLGLQRISIFL